MAVTYDDKLSIFIQLLNYTFKIVSHNKQSYTISSDKFRELISYYTNKLIKVMLILAQKSPRIIAATIRGAIIRRFRNVIQRRVDGDANYDINIKNTIFFSTTSQS